MAGVAGRSGRQEGSLKERPFRDALRMAIAEANKAADSHKSLRRIADALLEKAAEGDIQAIREVADRMDGKVPQAVTGEEGGAVVINVVKFNATEKS